MSRFNQGEIVLFPFPYTNLKGSKFRPALIISNSSVNCSEDRICLMISSVPNSKGIKILGSDVLDELPFESFVKTHRIITISQSVIRKTVSRVTDDFFERVVSDVSGFFELDK